MSTDTDGNVLSLVIGQVLSRINAQPIPDGLTAQIDTGIPRKNGGITVRMDGLVPTDPEASPRENLNALLTLLIQTTVKGLSHASAFKAININESCVIRPLIDWNPEGAIDLQVVGTRQVGIQAGKKTASDVETQVVILLTILSKP